MFLSYTVIICTVNVIYMEKSNHAELNEGEIDIDIDAPAVLLPILVEQVLHSQRQHNLQGYTIHQSWGYFLGSRSDPDPGSGSS